MLGVELIQKMSFWSEQFCCHVERQGLQKLWPQSRTRFGLSSTQMGQGSFTALLRVVGVDVPLVFGDGGGAEGTGCVLVQVEDDDSIAAAAFFSATREL
jgi:hypothetical protein